jgi:hypothetical protein
MAENDQSEQTEPVESSGRFSLWFWVSIAAVPVIYLLSIGPVALYVNKHESSEEFFGVVYAPVIWLHDHTFLEEPIEWYVEFWGGVETVP